MIPLLVQPEPLRGGGIRQLLLSSPFAQPCPIIAHAELRRTDVPRVVAPVTATSQVGYAFALLAFAMIAASGTTWLFASATALQATAATLVLLRSKLLATLPIEATP